MSETKSLVAVVPEVYYDLIARVAPGVVFLGTLASDPAFMQPPLTPRDLGGRLVVAFLLLGYTTGILLSGVAIGSLRGSGGGSGVARRNVMSNWPGNSSDMAVLRLCTSISAATTEIAPY